MAGEVSYTSSLSIQRPGLNDQPSDNGQYDLNSNRKVGLELGLTTSPTAMDLSALTTLGLAWGYNADATNTVVVEAGTTNAFQFGPGKGYFVNLVDGTSYRAKTDAGTATFTFTAWEGA